MPWQGKMLTSEVLAKGSLEYALILLVDTYSKIKISLKKNKTFISSSFPSSDNTQT